MRPSPLLLWCLGGLVLFGILASLWPVLVPWWWGALLLLAVVAAWQGVRLMMVKAPTVRRHVMGSLPLGVWRQVRLEVRNEAERDLVMAVFDLTWVLLPAGAIGAQVYWLLRLVGGAGDYHV